MRQELLKQFEDLEQQRNFLEKERKLFEQDKARLRHKEREVEEMRLIYKGQLEALE
jgi:hypothetical protein